MVVDMEVGVAHTLSSGQMSKDRMGRKLAFPDTEAFKQNAQSLYIDFEIHWRRTSLLLVHFRTCLDSVWPLKWEPQCRPFK